ncbi:MAG: hypothetical protein ACO3NI_14085, partial [bacterium]
SESIKFYGQTQPRQPKIELDPSKTILPLASKVLLPITTVNIKTLEVDLLRIDERSVSNLGYLYEGLSNYALNYIKDWKGESLGKF